MAWFRKETKTHFLRDDEGHVVHVEREETKPRYTSKTPVTDAAERQYYQKHPEETRTARLKKTGGRIAAAVDTWADNYTKNTQRARTKRRPAPMPMKTKPYRSPYMNIDPLGGMFDPWGSQPSQKKTSKSKKEYVIKGGIAYPVHKQGSFKKPKKKQSKEYDLFDNHGFF